MRTTLAGVAVTAALGAGALASQAATKPRLVKLTADPNGDLKFNTKNLTVKHGLVVIDMKDPSTSGTQHGIALRGKRVSKSGKIVDPGGTSKVKLTLKPGKYTFYCPVPGHEAAGMKGTLTVK